MSWKANISQIIQLVGKWNGLHCVGGETEQTNSNDRDVLGWLTIVLNASSLYDTVQSRVGLGDTGEIVLVGPARPDNLFSDADNDQLTTDDGDVLVQFVLPPFPKNHPLRAANKYLSFPLKDYPAVDKGFSEAGHDVYSIDTLISTHNEEDVPIACGYSDVPSDIVNWVLVFEQAHSEVVSPIDHLRDTILICAFSVLAGILVICLYVYIVWLSSLPTDISIVHLLILQSDP